MDYLCFTLDHDLMKSPLSPEILERRAKREASRAKQREANIGRAEKMHEVRLVTQLELNLSQDLPKAKSKQQYFIGCFGWFYWHWRGVFYPSDLPSKDWFAHYAANFKTVELNAPFYSWPTVATAKS